MIDLTEGKFIVTEEDIAQIEDFIENMQLVICKIIRRKSLYMAQSEKPHPVLQGFKDMLTSVSIEKENDEFDLNTIF